MGGWVGVAGWELGKGGLTFRVSRLDSFPYDPRPWTHRDPEPSPCHPRGTPVPFVCGPKGSLESHTPGLQSQDPERRVELGREIRPGVPDLWSQGCKRWVGLKGSRLPPCLQPPPPITPPLSVLPSSTLSHPTVYGPAGTPVFGSGILTVLDPS